MSNKKKRLWCSERFEAIFSSGALPDDVETIKKRRVIDFFLVPGRVQAKVQDDTGKLHRIEILVRQLTDSEWEMVFITLAKQAYFLACFLSSQLPEEIDEVLTAQGLSLVPSSADELDVVVDMERVVAPAGGIESVVLQKLCERLDEDPFSLFLIRGKGREESLLEIRRQRERLARPTKEELDYSDTEVETPVETETDSNYFRMKPKARELSYNLRADELPASILKRLDPLPLAGLEDDLEQVLEDVYAQVARRAQVYGLELKEK